MGLLDFLLGDDSSSNNVGDYDRSVFDTDRFRNNGSGGKMSAQAGMRVTASSILTLMKMESCIKFNEILLNLKCTLYNVNCYG